MLLKLTGDQITGYWENIKETLMFNELPIADAKEEMMHSILIQLLAERMQAWILCDLKDDQEVVYGMMVTSFVFEPVTMTKNFLIYSVYGYQFTPPAVWEDALEKIRMFAKVANCHKIIAYTKVPRVVEIVKALGGNVDTRLVTLEV